MRVTQGEVIKLLCFMVENEHLPENRRINIFRSDMNEVWNYPTITPNIIADNSDVLVFAVTKHKQIADLFHRETVVRDDYTIESLDPSEQFVHISFSPTIWSRTNAILRIKHFDGLNFEFNSNATFEEMVSFAKKVAITINIAQEGAFSDVN